MRQDSDLAFFICSFRTPVNARNVWRLIQKLIQADMGNQKASDL